MESKIVLITGTSKGIGKYLSEYFLNQRSIVIGCSRGEKTIDHENYTHFIADVSEEEDVKRVIRAIRKKYNRLDILINNAGVASMNHIVLTPVATVKKLLETNLTGVFLFTREAAKLMKKNGGGSIVNFSTVAVPLRLEGEAVYGASKAAVANFTQVASKELAEWNIRVNALGPTPTYTDLIKAVPKNKIDELIEKQAIKRLGEFKDISNVVDFFVRDESDFITGQIIYLGGVIN